MNSEGTANNCGGWAVLLGIAAGLAAATAAIAIYARARSSSKAMVNIDDIIQGVQQKISTVQKMIDSQWSSPEALSME